MSIKAMKQALQALVEIHPGNMTPMAEDAWNKAITALRQAIADAEKQEPVAWKYEGEYCYQYTDDIEIAEFYSQTTEKPQPLYLAPVHASDISQERVDETAKDRHEFECPRCGHCCQQREWVGLTDDDYEELLETKDWGGSLIHAVESKLKEKNECR